MISVEVQGAVYSVFIAIVNTCVTCHVSGVLIRVQVAWPSGLRRWFKAPVSSEAWVRIPPLSNAF